MASLSTAEKLLLIALDDERGTDTVNWGEGTDIGLAGALLLDLAYAGCLEEEDGKLVPRDCEAPHDELAAAALELIRNDERRRKPKAWLPRVQKELKPIGERVAEPLVAAGILEEERRKRLGLFETVRYPERDPVPERELRAQLADVLAGGREPTPEEAMLIALLHAYDLEKRLVEKPDRRAARKRGKEISEGDVIAEAVGKTVQEIQSATVAVLAGSTAATAATIGG